jgi:hypothetical protein
VWMAPMRPLVTGAPTIRLVTRGWPSRVDSTHWWIVPTCGWHPHVDVLTCDYGTHVWVVLTPGWYSGVDSSLMVALRHNRSLSSSEVWTLVTCVLL